LHGGRHEITVTKNDNLATAVTWQHKKEEHHPGKTIKTTL